MQHLVTHVLDVGIISQRHLRQTGNARLQAVSAFDVIRYFSFKLVEESGPFWPWANNGHLAAQYVDALRQLVNSRFAHEATHTRNTGILRARPYGTGFGFGVCAHGAKLDEVEKFCRARRALAHAHLAIEDRPA